MGGAHSESTSKGIKTSKVIFVLSLVLPYLVYWMAEEQFQQFAIYAPIWVAAINEGSTYVGPTPMALLMFVYWIPYVFVGYQSYRFAQGKYSSIRRYVAGVVFVTLIGVLFGLSLMGAPLAYSNETWYFPTIIPLPLVSILAIVFIPYLRPVVTTSLWEPPKQDVFLPDDTVVPVQDVDSQE